MYDEKGIDLLLSISKRCIASEDTVRMTCQVLRVITAANGLLTAHSSQLDIGTTLLLQNDRVIQLLDSVFISYRAVSSAIMTHCLLIAFYLLKQKGGVISLLSRRVRVASRASQAGRRFIGRANHPRHLRRPPAPPRAAASARRFRAPLLSRLLL